MSMEGFRLPKKLLYLGVVFSALLCHGAPAKPMVTFNIDASKAPEKKAWAEKELKPALEAYAKNVIELLDGKGTKWTRGEVTLILDPKGDLGNLLLTFPDLASEAVAPWVESGDPTEVASTPTMIASINVFTSAW